MIEYTAPTATETARIREALEANRKRRLTGLRLTLNRHLPLVRRH